MTNTIALGLGALILGGIAVDAFLTGGDGLFFVARKGLELIENLAFWR